MKILRLFLFMLCCCSGLQAVEDLTSRITECRNGISQNEKVLKMYDETLAQWHSYYLKTEGRFDLATVLKAIEFADQKHNGQYRIGSKVPYIIHPIGVARSLFEEGNVRNVNVLVAALLHDTLEDTATTAEEIEKLFGCRVRMTVAELTDNPELHAQEKYRMQVEHAPQYSFDAKLVKLADRLYNIRDVKNPPAEWSREFVIRYVQWGQKLLDALPCTNDTLEAALQREIQSFDL